MRLGEGRAGPVAAPIAVSEVTPNPWVEPSGPMELGPAISITRAGWRLIRYGDGSQDLFDLRSDPSEVRDVSNAVSARRLERLSEQIDSVLAVSPAARGSSGFAGLSREPRPTAGR